MFGSLHTLTELWLHELWGAPEKAFGLHDFEPLLQLRYLKEVFFRFSTKADLTDADIEVVLLAWPRLDSFRFIGLQFATINVLLPLARHPSLRVVEMYMDLAVELTPIVVPPILSQNSCSPGLTSLTLVQPNFDGLSYEPLALFISSVVPGVRCLCSSNYSFFQHETMETNTREFNEVLATISDNGHWSPETPRSQKLDN
ncbi:hypothetical protein DL96DRAFT_1631120 [Flagelloscypha sp. PMI_526]|nr:hypothetical protein DL96DRAFT_1631120 [Flagelloscypha sp. PMI_526]